MQKHKVNYEDGRCVIVNFPSPSLYNNIDYLYWRCKDLGTIEESLRIFPWIIRYIWKARNRKIFENICVRPQDTLDLAIQEEEVSRLANSREPPPEELSNEASVNLIPLDSPVCYIDESWHASDARSGHCGCMRKNFTNWSERLEPLFIPSSFRAWDSLMGNEVLGLKFHEWCRFCYRLLRSHLYDDKYWVVTYFCNRIRRLCVL